VPIQTALDLSNRRVVKPQPGGQRVHVLAFLFRVHLNGHQRYGVHLPGQFRRADPGDDGFQVRRGKQLLNDKAVLLR
jgi:hypothetical protein